MPLPRAAGTAAGPCRRAAAEIGDGQTIFGHQRLDLGNRVGALVAGHFVDLFLDLGLLGQQFLQACHDIRPRLEKDEDVRISEKPNRVQFVGGTYPTG